MFGRIFAQLASLLQFSSTNIHIYVLKTQQALSFPVSMGNERRERRSARIFIECNQ